MRKRLLHLSVFFILTPASISFAQSFSPEVIASSGSFASSASASMTWTLGETITDTYSPGSNFFTQGFNQPEINVLTSVSNNEQNLISVFPNPVAEQLFVNFPYSTSTFVIEIYDARGRLVKNDLFIPMNETQYPINVSGFSNGMYLINIINTKDSRIHSYKVNKIF